MLDPPKADKYLLTYGEFDEKQTQPQILDTPEVQPAAPTDLNGSTDPTDPIGR